MNDFPFNCILQSWAVKDLDHSLQKCDLKKAEALAQKDITSDIEHRLEQKKKMLIQTDYSSVLNRTTGQNRTHTSGLRKKHTPNKTHGSGLWF